jgi:hypothetical protein
VSQVSRLLVANKLMIGLHIRNVFDAPRDAVSNVSTEGQAAMAGAQKEYGAEASQKLLQWRRASHWTNFVHKMIALMREQRELAGHNASEPPLRFYLAADSEDAYEGMTKRFPGRLVYTRRECTLKRCDFRDCSCAAATTTRHPTPRPLARPFCAPCHIRIRPATAAPAAATLPIRAPQSALFLRRPSARHTARRRCAGAHAAPHVTLSPSPSSRVVAGA